MDERAIVDRITVELSRDTGGTDMLMLLTRAIRAGFAAGLVEQRPNQAMMKRVRALGHSGVEPKVIAGIEQIDIALVDAILSS